MNFSCTGNRKHRVVRENALLGLGKYLFFKLNFHKCTELGDE